MSRLEPSHCSCSICTQIRNERPKLYRYFDSFRCLRACLHCLPQREFIMERTFASLESTARISTITFRDADIVNKHCSKHDVMIKPTRPHLTRLQNEELRQRVRSANQRWTRMSILPANLIDFTFQNKDLIPLCTLCYDDLSALIFNLCHGCIANLVHFKEELRSTDSFKSTVNEATEAMPIHPSYSTCARRQSNSRPPTMNGLQQKPFSRSLSLTHVPVHGGSSSRNR